MVSRYLKQYKYQRGGHKKGNKGMKHAKKVACKFLRHSLNVHNYI